MIKSRRKAAFDFEKLIAGGSNPAPFFSRAGFARVLLVGG
jgi:hypothetical protein